MAELAACGCGLAVMLNSLEHSYYGHFAPVVEEEGACLVWSLVEEEEEEVHS